MPEPLLVRVCYLRRGLEGRRLFVERGSHPTRGGTLACAAGWVERIPRVVRLA